jgi:hypothetical protein
MNLIRNLLVYILTATLLVSATGILVFHSFCTCTGHNHYSLYVTPETCAESYHVHHKHSYYGYEQEVSADECHECSAHNDMCGCNDLAVKLYKLDDRLLNDNIRVEKMLPVLVKILQDLLPVSQYFFEDIKSAEFIFCESPPGIRRSLDFLILIHQLKIPAFFKL